MQLLVDAGGDVNARALGAFTPLHVAAEGGKAGIAEVLLKVRPRGQQRWGSMAGRVGAGRGSAGLHGCRCAAMFTCCSSRRHSAAFCVCGEGAQLTLPARLPCHPFDAPQAGADPQAKDEHGHTPARVAAMHKHRQLVELLLGRTGEGGSGGSEGASASGSGAGSSGIDEFMASSQEALKEREAKVGSGPRLGCGWAAAGLALAAGRAPALHGSQPVFPLCSQRAPDASLCPLCTPPCRPAAAATARAWWASHSQRCRTSRWLTLSSARAT